MNTITETQLIIEARRLFNRLTDFKRSSISSIRYAHAAKRALLRLKRRQNAFSKNRSDITYLQ